jgi:N-formylglutamate amidohydrolase
MTTGAAASAREAAARMRDESQGLSDFDPPFELFAPAGAQHPVVLSSPHSGAIYPQAFFEASRLDPLTLRRSEDAYVDALFEPASALGVPLLRARFPRAFLDLNREPFELDPQMFSGRLPDFANTRSLRVAAGLGVIPRLVGDAQPIYREPIPVAAALRRIATLHRPYHARLAELLARAQARFGLAVLIDCHSMPSTSRRALDRRAPGDIAARSRSRGASQQTLCRRVHHGELRGAGCGPACGASRDQPQSLYGRAHAQA